MLEYIKGNVSYLAEDRVVVENNGMGFCINTSTNTLSQIHSGEIVTIYVHMHVQRGLLHSYQYTISLKLQLYQVHATYQYLQIQSQLQL